MSDDDLFGTPPHMLHRRDAPDTSVEAAKALDSATLEEMVFGAIGEFGEAGCIADDLLARFPTFPYSSVTARFAALERKELIYYLGDKRRCNSGRQQRVIRKERRSIKRDLFGG